jgi:hypothetical protein
MLPLYLSRSLTVIIGILTAFFGYLYLIKPLLLEPLCLIGSNQCINMEYYNYNNSALVNMKNSGLWVWYNGDKAFIYGQPVGQLCQDPKNYTSAYTINTRTGLKEGYQCVISLEKVLDFYTSKNIKPKFITKRTDKNFDVYDALNILNNERIINLN